MNYKTPDQVLSRLKACPENHWGQRPSLNRFRPRLGLFRASNYKFDPISLNALSYNWWSMLTTINGRLIRNDYNYSLSTQRHQSKLSSDLRALGIKPDLTVQCPYGLQSNDWLINALSQMSHEYAKTFVRLKYARKTNPWLQQSLKKQKLNLEKLAQFGQKKRQLAKLLKTALKDAEQSRKEHNLQLKEKRKAQKAQKTLKTYPELYSTEVCPNNVIQLNKGA